MPKLKVFKVSITDDTAILVKASTAKAAIRFAAQTIEAVELSLDDLLNAVQAKIEIHDPKETTVA